jgi:hypothetical protein
MRITDPTVDQLAELCARDASYEVGELLHELGPADLTGCEKIAMLTILRPVLERKEGAGDETGIAGTGAFG